MTYVIIFLIGAALGGAGVGWVMYNKLGAIREKAKKYGVNL